VFGGGWIIVRRKIFAAIEEIIDDPKRRPPRPLSWSLRLINIACIIAYWITIYLCFRGCDYLVNTLHLLTWTQFWTIFLGYSVTVTILLYKVYARPLI